MAVDATDVDGPHRFVALRDGVGNGCLSNLPGAGWRDRWRRDGDDLEKVVPGFRFEAIGFEHGSNGRCGRQVSTSC